MSGYYETLHAPTEDLLDVQVPIYLWSPDGISNQDELPLLLVKDGGEYNETGNIIQKINQFIKDGRIPHHRVALVDTVRDIRHVWYSAAPEYVEATKNRILPAITEHVETSNDIIALGGSLGAVTLFACELKHPDTFKGILSQSMTFINREKSSREEYAKFFWPYYDRTADLSDRLQHGLPQSKEIQISMTCGNEPLLEMNKELERAFIKNNHHVSHQVFLDGNHSYESRAECLDPVLPELASRVWRNKVALAA